MTIREALRILGRSKYIIRIESTLLSKRPELLDYDVKRIIDNPNLINQISGIGHLSIQKIVGCAIDADPELGTEWYKKEIAIHKHKPDEDTISVTKMGNTHADCIVCGARIYSTGWNACRAVNYREDCPGA